jgi:carboxymethylenebutenolidase
MRIAPVLFVAAALLVVASPARAQHEGHDHGHDPAHAAATPARDASLPAGEEAAKDVLEHSPRHGEYLDVPLASGGTVKAWVVYPERKDKAGVVILIHEIFGLSDWMRALADQVAADGFVAVAPDLITGFGPGGGGTESVASRDSVVALVRRLTLDVTRERLDAVHAWAVKEPAANGRTATMGFCWGGTRSFQYAGLQPALAGAVVYYGSTPDSALVAGLRAPVLAHYGGDDARVNATIPLAERVSKAAKKRYTPHVYDGAGHGFLRQQSGREGANLRASREAWPRTVAFLREVLKTRK